MWCARVRVSDEIHGRGDAATAAGYADGDGDHDVSVFFSFSLNYRVQLFELGRRLFCACVSPCIYVYLRALRVHTCANIYMCVFAFFFLFFPKCLESLPPSPPSTDSPPLPAQAPALLVVVCFPFGGAAAPACSSTLFRFLTLRSLSCVCVCTCMYMFVCVCQRAEVCSICNSPLHDPPAATISPPFSLTHTHTRTHGIKKDDDRYLIPVKAQRRCCAHVHARMRGGKAPKQHIQVSSRHTVLTPLPSLPLLCA